jgi:hypothetical protein
MCLKSDHDTAADVTLNGSDVYVFQGFSPSMIDSIFEYYPHVPYAGVPLQRPRKIYRLQSPAASWTDARGPEQGFWTARNC